MKQNQNQLKKFSTATLENINRLSPEELETHGTIQAARVSGYICPLCSSGDGSHGTGMTQNPKIESHTSLHCFGNGAALNLNSYSRMVADSSTIGLRLLLETLTSNRQLLLHA